MPCERLGFLDFGPALQHKVDIRNSQCKRLRQEYGLTISNRWQFILQCNEALEILPILTQDWTPWWGQVKPAGGIVTLWRFGVHYVCI